MNNVGDKIKKLRKENKDTLISLSNKIEYDYSNLSKVERGVYDVSVDLLYKIANTYGVSMNYFFEEKSIVDGVEVSKEELEQAVRLIRTIRKNCK